MKNKSTLSKCLSKIALTMLGICGASSVYAAECYPSGGAYPYLHQYEFNSTENYIGYTTPWQNLARGGTYTIAGPCASRLNNTFFTFKEGPGLTSAGGDSNGQWFDIPGNDYLQVAIQVYLAGNRREFVNIPQKGVSNLCNGSCGSDYATGGQIKIKLRIKKKFVGQSFVVNRDVGLIYAASSASDNPTRPVATIRLNAQMTVPQSCRFDVGDIIEFDFGEIPSNAFSNAGAGQRATGVNAITKNIGIECKNIDAQQMLSARLEASNPSGNAVVSDNPDVGFQLADKDDRVLIPNTLNSFIPFKLDENSRGNFIIKSWPVSLTGQLPKPGPVAAQAHLRIDFQ